MNGAILPTHDASLSFLQTVVIVDDHAYVPLADSAAEAATLDGEEIHDYAEEPLSQQVVDDASSFLDPEALDTEKIVERFADLGMTCAVLAPKFDNEILDSERLLKVANRADVLILDWIIRPTVAVNQTNNGPKKNRTSMELLQGILRADAEKGARLRLVCIYTGSRNLRGILDQISEQLGKEFSNVKANSESMYIDVSVARIVLLNKDSQINGDEASTVAAIKLPDRVVEEFSSFASSGILPQLALSSLSVIRDQAHQLLRRFNSSLDPAVLAHRSTTSPIDTEQFIVSLIGDELSSLISAGNVTQALSDDNVTREIQDRFAGRSEAYAWSAFNDEASAKTLKVDDAIKALSLGVDDETRIKDGSGVKLAVNASRTSLLLAGSQADVRGNSRRIDLEFSALSSLSRDRAFDGERLTPPELHLGTLVMQPDDGPGEGGVVNRYWLCLQPLCDSARLTEQTRFPFLPLTECDPKSSSFDLVVHHQGYRALKLQGLKFNQVTFFNFQPELNRSAVVASWCEEAWEFRTASFEKLVWLGNIRLDKAHKLIHAVVTDAGRIGINEYEYLRRLSSK